MDKPNLLVRFFIIYKNKTKQNKNKTKYHEKKIERTKRRDTS